MEQVLEFFQKLFDTSDWPPRWHCGNWTDFHGWFYIVSDLLIWSAYFAIPLTILKYISKRTDAKFIRTYFLFAGFILACGSTHLLDAITFWFPAYRVNALVRFITGVVSWITVFHIVKILPVATSLRSHAELEKEIAERTKVEEQLKIANRQLVAAQEIARLGNWEWDVSANKITWSDQLYKIYDTAQGSEISYEAYLEKLHPEDRDMVDETIQNAFAGKVFPSFTHRIILRDGTQKVLQARGEVVVDPNGSVVKMIGTAQDITEAQVAQQQLVERTHALEVTNAELQRFAYVASHDLQEPLRKIMTFASLLDIDVRGKVSEKGQMYMEKIVQSAGRMQRLIDDILAFSKLRGSGEAFQPTDLNRVLQQVLSDMEVRIEATGATVKADSLPVIDAVPSQMQQLFQNLISNALKFRKDDVAPVITITSSLIYADEIAGYQFSRGEKADNMQEHAFNWGREQFVKLEIMDNGIGFEETYAEKIFEIFQRLHNNRTFEGTGIGLAICKKVVDNHHGSINAYSQKEKGATFLIFLPVSQRNFLTKES